jgi:hypothetical protein
LCPYVWRVARQKFIADTCRAIASMFAVSSGWSKTCSKPSGLTDRGSISGLYVSSND